MQGDAKSSEKTPSPPERELRIMDPKAGDIRLAWSNGSPDPDAPAREMAAREAFDKAKGLGTMIFYRMNFDGSGGEQIKEFDPAAERIVGMPFPVGG
jgi:hypothetical protein